MDKKFNKVSGAGGEEKAINYLKDNGFKIIKTNFTTNIGEIDIIAKDKDTFVFCEVKTRSTMICGNPLEAITKSKYQNIKKGIFFYMQENPECKKYRIDAISIILKPKLDIRHLKNV